MCVGRGSSREWYNTRLRLVFINIFVHVFLKSQVSRQSRYCWHETYNKGQCTNYLNKNKYLSIVFLLFYFYFFYFIFLQNIFSLILVLVSFLFLVLLQLLALFFTFLLFTIPYIFKLVYDQSSQHLQNQSHHQGW